MVVLHNALLVLDALVAPAVVVEHAEDYVRGLVNLIVKKAVPHHAQILAGLVLVVV